MTWLEVSLQTNVPYLRRPLLLLFMLYIHIWYITVPVLRSVGATIRSVSFARRARYKKNATAQCAWPSSSLCLCKSLTQQFCEKNYPMNVLSTIVFPKKNTSHVANEGKKSSPIAEEDVLWGTRRRSSRTSSGVPQSRWCSSSAPGRRSPMRILS